MLKFKEDENGFTFENQRGQAWILKRPSYCDRGRFCWGQNGFVENRVMPSYYFFDINVAKEEVSSFVFSTTSDLTPKETEKDLSKELLARHNLIPNPSVPKSWMKLVPWPDGTTHVISMSLVDTDYDNAPNETLWEVSEGSIPFVDASDAFPRYFRFVKNALSEMDAFIACRQQMALSHALEKQPVPPPSSVATKKPSV